MPHEFYIVVGCVAAVILAFVWLRRASKERIDNPQRDDDREEDIGGYY